MRTHHAVGDDYRSIIHALLYMAQAKIHIIGLTATPKNTNGSRIEEIFLHGIDPKSKQPTDKTCYASRVSINQLIAEGYLAKPFLAKKKDSSPEKLSDEELCNRIIDTYEKGVCALALETPSSQDEDTKAPKELNPNNSFGQTVIFVKSREVARLLWSKFLARDIDCGISISMLWSSIFVTLMANKIGGLQFGIYRNCQISSRVFHTAVAALPLTKANRSDFE